MLIAGVITFCILLIVLAFLLPRLSRHPERGGQRIIGAGSRTAGKAPGRAGRLLQKPFHSSSKAVAKCGSAGRRGRGKMPF
jgi:hypothetical protein